MTERPSYIYALIDPYTDQVRYVGVSINPRKRLGQHWSNPSDGMEKWIRRLRCRDRKRKPQVVILATGRGTIWRDAAETFWIHAAETAGARLCQWHKAHNAYTSRQNKGARLDAVKRAAARTPWNPRWPNGSGAGSGSLSRFRAWEDRAGNSGALALHEPGLAVPPATRIAVKSPRCGHRRAELIATGVWTFIQRCRLCGALRQGRREYGGEYFGALLEGRWRHAEEVA